MSVTDAMVDGALDAHVDAALSDRKTAMRAALTAALAVSGYGDAVEALRSFPLPSMTSQDNYRLILAWLYNGKQDVASLIINLECAAIASVPREPRA